MFRLSAAVSFADSEVCTIERTDNSVDNQLRGLTRSCFAAERS